MLFLKPCQEVFFLSFMTKGSGQGVLKCKELLTPSICDWGTTDDFPTIHLVLFSAAWLGWQGPFLSTL